ncbi:MAG: PTS transporter subunit EIIA, partial [Bacteroidetes bacterium]|nr:PTS transporter subunit EIIA [Bacteroidota bacterium]
VKTFELSAGFTYETLQERYDDEAIPLFLRRGDELIVFSERGAITPGPGDTLVAFVPSLDEPEETQGAAPFEQLVARAFVVDLEEEATYEEVVRQASALLAQRVPRSMDELADEFLQKVQSDILPIRHGVALPHCRLPYIEEPELVLVRCSSGLCIELENNGAIATSEPIYAFLMLVSPEQNPKQHLQVLANIASRIDDAEQFLEEWRGAGNEQQLKETLLHHDRFLSLDLNTSEATSQLIGQRVGELDLPEGNVVTLLHRGGDIRVPGSDTVLREGDRITITGDSSGIHRLYQQFRSSMPPQREPEPEPEDVSSADPAS